MTSDSAELNDYICNDATALGDNQPNGFMAMFKPEWTDATAGTFKLKWFGDDILQNLVTVDVVFTYSLTNSKGNVETFTQNVSIQKYQKPVLSADPTASHTLYNGLSFEYTFPVVTTGGTVPEYIAEISYSGSVETWLVNTLPFTTLGAYNLADAAYITWSTTDNNLIKISYDGTKDVSSFVGGSAIVVTLKIADKLQYAESTYTTSISVQTATPPTFSTDLPDTFTVYTAE